MHTAQFFIDSWLARIIWSPCPSSHRSGKWAWWPNQCDKQRKAKERWWTHSSTQWCEPFCISRLACRYYLRARAFWLCHVKNSYSPSYGWWYRTSPRQKEKKMKRFEQRLTLCSYGHPDMRFMIDYPPPCNNFWKVWRLPTMLNSSLTRQSVLVTPSETAFEDHLWTMEVHYKPPTPWSVQIVSFLTLYAHQNLTRDSRDRLEVGFREQGVHKTN